ncbi:MAG TPA: flavodoxin domain-containing protein [Gemmatimonadaceae bacterium]|nr:flavodoxin domain-containing protein [Gemmatimonadaceae bacterium]
MHPHRVLVLYGTSYGQTTRIAARIANRIEESGAVVSFHDIRELRMDAHLESYDAVIIGASVIRGRHQRAVQEFVSQHCEMLNVLPTAFFSVSGSAASPDERGRADARRCAESFLRATHWRPAITELVGGAMAYTKYGPLLRWIMKQIAKRNHGPIDTSCDHEMTDWAQVMRFSDRFIALLDQVSVNTALASR